MKLTRSYLLAFLFAGTVCTAIAADSSKSPVIAVHHTYYYGTGNIGKGNFRRETSYRDAVVTELVKNYDCMVVHRARPFYLTMEGSLGEVRSLGSMNPTNLPVLAADYAIRVFFGGQAYPSGLPFGKIQLADLRGSSNSWTEIVSPGEKDDEMPGVAASLLAKRLNLRRRIAPRAESSPHGGGKHAWAVLPFMRFDAPPDGRGLSPHEDLTLPVEKALQEPTAPHSVVDRRDIDRSLAELKISGVVQDSVANLLARLVGADLVVVGSVLTQQNGLRADVHIVDAKNGLVLSADSATGISKEELPAVVCRMVTNLATFLPPVPEIRTSTKAERFREADLCLDATGDLEGNTPERGMTFWTGVPSYTYYGAALVLNGAEVASVLARDDPARLYRAAWCIRYFFVRGTCAVGDSPDSPMNYPDDITDRAAYLTEHILASFPDDPGKLVVRRSPKDPAPWVADRAMPLLLRADALRYMKKYRDAWQMIERHSAKCPDNNPRWARLLKVLILVEQDKMDEAKPIMDEVMRDFPTDNSYLCPVRTDKLLLQIASASKDDQSIYKALSSSSDLSESESATLISLMLKLDGPERALQKLEKLDWHDELYHSYYWMLPLARARCLALMGKKTEAAEICGHLVESHLQIRAVERALGPSFEADEKEVSSLFQSLKKEGWVRPDTWKKAADVRPFPKNLKVYVYTIGPDRWNLYPKTAQMVGDFLGTVVEVLHSTVQLQTNFPWTDPLADPGYEVLKATGTGERNASATLRDAVQCAEVPSDCVLAIFTAEAQHQTGFFPPAITEQCGNPSLLIKQNFAITKDEAKAVSLALTTLWVLYHTYSSRHTDKAFPEGVPVCPNHPCVFSRWCNTWTGEATGAIFKMCPACQEEYKKADFNKMQKALRDHMLGAAKQTGMGDR